MAKTQKKVAKAVEYDACKLGVRGVDYMVGWADDGVLDIYDKIDELIQEGELASKHLLAVTGAIAGIARDEDFFPISELHQRLLILRGNLVSLKFGAKKIGGWTFV